MADPEVMKFTHKELAEVLVKHKALHAGIWGLYFEFGIKAVNAGSADDQMLPTALVPVLGVGLQQFPTENNLSVDASKVNPAPAERGPAGKSPKAKRAAVESKSS